LVLSFDHFAGEDTLAIISRATEFTIFQIFTHKTPFEGVPMPHGLVAFLIQAPTPNHPSANSTEVVSATAPVRPSLKRKRTPVHPMPATNYDALKAAAIAAAEVLPSEEEGHSAVKRGLSDEMWSLLQSCWKYEPHARPTMNKILKRLNEIVPVAVSVVKNVTAQVRKTTIFPVATGGQCDVCPARHLASRLNKLTYFIYRYFSASL
jgi:hypothetical protein